MTKTFLLPEDIRNALLGYLVQRPYSEVAKGVQMLEGLPELPEAPAQKPVLAAVPDAEKEK